MPSLQRLHIGTIRAKRFAKGLLIGQYWKIRGVSLADRIIVEGTTPRLYAAGAITLGSRLMFRCRHVKSQISSQPKSTLKIGDRVFINGGCIIDASLSIEVGDHCKLGDGCQIRDSNYHEIDEGAGVKQAPIKIGRNVWLGTNAMIMPGVEIGDHSVVGANSVVTKSVPPRTLVSGNPAKVIRELDASETYIRA